MPTQPRRWTVLAIVVSFVAAVLSSAVGPSPVAAQAQPWTLTVDFVLTNSNNGDGVPSDFTMEVWDINGSLVASGPGPLIANLPGPGIYAIGMTGPGTFSATNATCEVDPGEEDDEEELDEPLNLPGSTIIAPTLPPGAEWEGTCDFAIWHHGPPSLTLTKQVNNFRGGTAVHSDFILEIYDENGQLLDSGPSPLDTELPRVGEFTVGESGPNGYRATSLACSSEFQADEPLEGPFSTITIPTPPYGHSGHTSCVLRNQDIDIHDVQVTKVLDPANAGAASVSDFTLEIYDDNGQLVDSGPSPLNAELSREGTYTIGESGPDGYTATDVTCTPTHYIAPVEEEEEEEEFDEALSDLAGASFTAPRLEFGDEWSISCVVTNAATASPESQPNTTSTTVPAGDNGADNADAPATGSENTSNPPATLAFTGPNSLWLTLLAVGLLLVGGVLSRATRKVR